MIVYLKKLFTKWILLLGLLPDIYDYASAFLGIDFTLPKLLKYTFILCVFIYASYSVWKDEYNEKLILRERFKNPVDYKISAKLSPLYINVDKDLTQLEDKIKKIPSELKKIDKEIETYSTSYGLGINPHLFQAYMGQTKTRDQYLVELREYKNELLRYRDDFEDNKTKMLDDLDKYKEKKYYVKFIIENIGNKSDEQIDISITTNNRLLQGYETLIEYKKCIPSYPRKPEPPKNDLIDPQLNYHSHLVDFEYPGAYRTYQKIDEHNISVVLREMNVGDEVDIVKKNLCIDLVDPPIIKVLIKSKKSTSVIEKDVALIYSQEAIDIEEMY